MSRSTARNAKRKNFTPAQLQARYEETAGRYAACRARGDHDFRLAKVTANVFHPILPDAFVELHESAFVAIYECTRCNAFSLAPIGRDMRDMEESA